jgi:di/tricarboxylate transporter
MKIREVISYLVPFWRTFVLVITPLVFLPVLLSGTSNDSANTDSTDLFNGSLPSPVAIGSGSPSGNDGSNADQPSDYEPMVCAYVLLIMSVYWMTEALPLPITSLIPVVAFPLAGVISTVNVLFLLRLHPGLHPYFHRMPCVTFYFTVNSTLGLVKI